MGKVEWSLYPPQLAFQAVNAAPNLPLATLPSGVLDLVFRFQTPQQTILRTEWTVINGPDKRGTPLLGNSVFRTLEVGWLARCETGNEGTLTFTTHQGIRGTLTLLYTTNATLPAIPPNPIESASGRKDTSTVHP
eukprot:1181440-Prorocentrum_minimum.AAC.3